MTEQEKRWIDSASYEQLLRHWRFARVGDPMFAGDTGDYFAKRMHELREQVGNDECVRVSKSIGW